MQVHDESVMGQKVCTDDRMSVDLEQDYAGSIARDAGYASSYEVMTIPLDGAVNRGARDHADGGSSVHKDLHPTHFGGEPEKAGGSSIRGSRRVPKLELGWRSWWRSRELRGRNWWRRRTGFIRIQNNFEFKLLFSLEHFERFVPRTFVTSSANYAQA